jgi:hypothetical protein
MLNTIWSFIRDDQNRTVLAWIGGGVVAAAGIVLKFVLAKRNDKGAPVPTVSASSGGVAAGRDIRDSSIRTSRESEK